MLSNEYIISTAEQNSEPCVGKALIGHRLDDEVRIKVPSGVRMYEVIDIKYE